MSSNIENFVLDTTERLRVLFWARTDFARNIVVETLAHLSEVRVVCVQHFTEMLAELERIDILVLSDCPVEEARKILSIVNQPGAQLRAVHFITAGRDGFIAAGGFREDLLVSGPEGAIAPVVAEHAIGLALAINRQLLPAYDAQRQALWDRSFIAGTASLEGGTVLIVGAGAIGREVARRASAFGMRCIAVTRDPKDDKSFEAVHAISDLPMLLPTADAVVLCIALGPETRHLISWNEFALCRPSAILVNVGRGGLVDQDALEDALRSGRIAGAGLDVTDPEPLPERHSLWSAPNLLITAHYAGAGSHVGERRIADSVVSAVRVASMRAHQ
ncbi:D-2-hydroxyacid dehydrogenase [Brucella anthropi]|uniref:D-2-hydroxyacid dehydrogenase n=1 Tax=Brucella anthropi TaxID=529 RepID=UPI001CFD5BA8|nr:D-2-hydroxyacid dehydrogenase [Brucella anthropi]